MASKKDYIPGGILDFREFEGDLVGDVTTNAVAWGIAAGRVTALTGAQGVYEPLFDAIKNKKKRTQEQVNDHSAGRKVYVKFIRAFVKENLINNSLISRAQKLAMGLNPGDDVRHDRPAIESIPDINLGSLGGARVRIVARVDSEVSRPSIHADSDGVEVRYSIGTTPPANVWATDKVYFSSKARFSIPLGVDNKTKIIYLFGHWKNNKDDSKSGDWTEMDQVVIS